MNIREQYGDLLLEQVRVNRKMAALQVLCEHPDSAQTFRREGGELHPSVISKWVERRCQDCGRFWSA